MVLGLPSRTRGRGGAVVSCLTSEYSGTSFWGGSSQLQFPRLHLFARWTPIPESELPGRGRKHSFPSTALSPAPASRKMLTVKGQVIFLIL